MGLNVIERATTFTYEQLSAEAQESAREWFRRDGPGYHWSSGVEDDAHKCGELLGISISHFSIEEPTYIRRCGRVSGSLRFRMDAHAAIKAYAPTETGLHQIAMDLQVAAITFRLHAGGHEVTDFYASFASNNAGIYITATDGLEAMPEGLALKLLQNVEDALTAFELWLSSCVRAEFEEANKDAAIEDSIICNDYRFDEDGNHVRERR